MLIKFLLFLEEAGVNFIDILQAAFMRADHKSAKICQVISVFLRFWDLHVQKLLLKCW